MQENGYRQHKLQLDTISFLRLRHHICRESFPGVSCMRGKIVSHITTDTLQRIRRKMHLLTYRVTISKLNTDAVIRAQEMGEQMLSGDHSSHFSEIF